MKKLFTVLGAVCAALFLCPKIYAAAGGQLVYDNYLPVPAVAAYSSTFSVRADGINWASAQILVSSVTQANGTFNDGQQATGTFTVASYTALSTAAATGNLTMVSVTLASGTASSASVAVTSNVSGTQVTITGPPPGTLQFFVGGEFASSNTAVDLVGQINSGPTIWGITASTTSANAVKITCVSSGTFCNAYAVSSSSPTAVSTAAFSGGVNPVSVTVGPATFVAGVNFVPSGTTTTMAANLATAIAASSQTTGVTATSGGAIVYTTATVPGTAGNLFPLVSSNQLAISTSTNFMSGGTNNAVACVNAVCVTANSQWYPATSNTATATSLAAAFNATVDSLTVTFGGSAAVVGATATADGSLYNYSMTSSSNNALSVSVLVSSNPATGTSVGVMAGGTNPAYLINTSTITQSTQNLGLGEAVAYSTGSNVGITPLVWGTTYYIITNAALGTGNIELATSQANALAGTAIVLTSSTSKPTADTFTLTVPAMAGTPGVSLEASNDNQHWIWYNLTPFNVAVGSNTYASYTAGGQMSTFDLGHFDYSYIGVSVVAPTAGAINVQAHIVGNAP